MPNNTAGIGDPYWYEWLVGLLYVVQMLNPDNNISHVTLQASQTQSLDDVVLTYEDNSQLCIQVKHTREDSSFTFSNLISGDGHKSYLSSFSSQWKELRDAGQKSNVMLFTNRELGSRSYRDKNGLIPPMNQFWPELSTQLETADDIQSIKFRPEWMDAWKMFLDKMNILSSEEQLDFLKGFEIKAGQHDLQKLRDDVLNELEQTFQIAHSKAVELQQKLCYSLMEWVTTSRKKEQIEPEDVLEALSLASDESVDCHMFPVSEPFFHSRVTFVDSLEQHIQKSKFRMIFLTGEPGCGKTNIISYMACKPDSIVTVRFHTFRPLLPGDLYLSADEGISDPRVFWSSLLTMFRTLFKDRLYEYHVPVSSKLIDSLDKLRSEVLRLAATWAEISGKITVIAVDGIDHAARAGGRNTFLKTLPPPETIPEQVRFLLAGQPVHLFDGYPDFLSDQEQVDTINVPLVQKDDLNLLYEQYGSDMKYAPLEREALIQYIAHIAAGNTLSAVFAIREAIRYSTFVDFEAGSHVRKLCEGVSAYYEYIWTVAMDKIGPEQQQLDMLIAAAFSLLNRKLPAQALCDMFAGHNIPLYIWESVLNKLSPIISYDSNGYSVFHNDVRIFLMAHYRKAGSHAKTINGEIANYLLQDTFDSKIKHEIVFQLLKDSGQTNRYVDVFTVQYVLEALNLKRSPHELHQQMLATLDSIGELDDKRALAKTCCAIMTMQQHRESLNWLAQDYDYELELPFALPSELKTVPDELLTEELLANMLSDVAVLVNCNELVRAKNILARWLGTKSPKNLCVIFRGAVVDENVYKDVLTTWGKYARRLMVPPVEAQYLEEDEKYASAMFFKGWLKESKLHIGPMELENTMSSLQVCYKKDCEQFFQEVIHRCDKDELTYVLNTESIRNRLLASNKIRACAWALHNEQENLCTDWLDDICQQGFDFIPEINPRDLDAKKVVFGQVSDVIYILCRMGVELSDEKLNNVVAMCTTDANRKKDLLSILRLIICLAILEDTLLYGQGDKIDSRLFANALEIILYRMGGYYGYLLHITAVREKMLNYILHLSQRLPSHLQKILMENLEQKASCCDDTFLFAQYWRYLKCHGREDILQVYFDRWLSKDGKLWQVDLSDREYIAQPLLQMANELEWKKQVEDAERLLFVRRIGYVGRKDYSLYTPLNWFKRVAEQKPDIWKQEGLLLLNLSDYASDIGDNRAYVSILGAVAEAAGKAGVNSLFQFAGMAQNSSLPWKETVFDGVISALERDALSEADLTALWECATEHFMVRLSGGGAFDRDDERNRIYVADIHEGIRLCSQRMGYENIEVKLRDIAPREFSQKRVKREETSQIVPERWYDSPWEKPSVRDFIAEVGMASPDEIFNMALQRYTRNDFSWEFIVYFIDRAKLASPECITRHKSDILGMLQNRDPHYCLEWDGCYQVYDALFPYLDESDITRLWHWLVDSYRCRYSDYMESADYGLMTDITQFTFALFSRYSWENNLSALREILKMHCIWQTGDEIFTLHPRYNLRDLSSVNSWAEFCSQLNWAL